MRILASSIGLFCANYEDGGQQHREDHTDHDGFPVIAAMALKIVILGNRSPFSISWTVAGAAVGAGLTRGWERQSMLACL